MIFKNNLINWLHISFHFPNSICILHWKSLWWTKYGPVGDFVYHNFNWNADACGNSGITAFVVVSGKRGTYVLHIFYIVYFKPHNFMVLVFEKFQKIVMCVQIIAKLISSRQRLFLGSIKKRWLLLFLWISTTNKNFLILIT